VVGPTEALVLTWSASKRLAGWREEVLRCG
jgi:hypothetical protein